MVKAARAREAGQKRVLIFKLSGHGLLDLSTYETYLTGKLQDARAWNCLARSNRNNCSPRQRPRVDPLQEFVPSRAKRGILTTPKGSRKLAQGKRRLVAPPWVKR